MKTLHIKTISTSTQYAVIICIALLGLLAWQLMPSLLRSVDPTVAILDNSIWQFGFVALAFFVSLTLFSWHFLKWQWQALGLGKINIMVSHFKQLELWQQFVLYWASYALPLLAATGCLIAVF